MVELSKDMMAEPLTLKYLFTEAAVQEHCLRGSSAIGVLGISARSSFDPVAA
jgi:hypothetical protein